MMVFFFCKELELTAELKENGKKHTWFLFPVMKWSRRPASTPLPWLFILPTWSTSSPVAQLHRKNPSLQTYLM